MTDKCGLVQTIVYFPGKTNTNKTPQTYKKKQPPTNQIVGPCSPTDFGGP